MNIIPNITKEMPKAVVETKGFGITVLMLENTGSFTENIFKSRKVITVLRKP